LASRILMPELDLEFTNKANREIPVNRFQIMSRLMQYYIVDAVSSAIDYRLEWHKNNKDYIFGKPPSDETVGRNDGGVDDDDHESENDENTHDHQHRNIDDYDDDVQGLTDMTVDESHLRSSNSSSNSDAPETANNNTTYTTKSSPTYLGASHHGSRRHLRKKATDALTIISERGKPHLFITLTFNTKWPEVQEMLLSGQTAYDRPDIVARVFKARLEAFLSNLRKGKYLTGNGSLFSGHKVDYLMYVIEYQHRGLPHAHIVLRLADMPDNTRDYPRSFNV